MCLAIPVKIEKVLSDSEAVANIGGLLKTISTALVEAIQPGDYVIMHVGYALEKLDTEEAEATLKQLHELAQPPEGETDSPNGHASEQQQ